MSFLKFSLLLIIFTVFVSQSLLVLASAEANEGESALALSRAEQVTVSAYQAVLEAEQAGANVSILLIQLNDAGEFLAEAKVDFRLSELDEAIYLANLCSETCNSVKKQADELGIQAYRSKVLRIQLMIFGSLVGSFTVLIGSFCMWRSFKRRYYERVLRMKPEVVHYES